MYRRHPNRALNEAFVAKPYQGVDPADATFLFVGLDANYAEDLDAPGVLDSLLAYHRDGVAFWQRHGVHHPFLLPAYRGGGRPYHRNFARIGFRAEHAPLVGFVELLHVPTVGRNALAPDDLDPAHLARIDDAITRGRARHVFVSYTAWRLMHASKAFAWLRPPRSEGGVLPVVHAAGARTVRKHLHFSCYGKFGARMAAEAEAIAALLPPSPPGDDVRGPTAARAPRAARAPGRA